MTLFNLIIQMANKRRKVVNGFKFDNIVNDYGQVLEKYNLRIDTNNINQLPLVRKINNMLCTREYIHDYELIKLMYDLPITCQLCNMFTTKYVKARPCRYCKKLLCKDCAVIDDSHYMCAYGGTTLIECVECHFMHCAREYAYYVANGWRGKFSNLTTLDYLPVDLWRIVFDYTYKTNDI